MRAREPASPLTLGNELPALLTILEVAEFTRSPVTSVRGWLSSGRLRSTRPGKKRLIPRAELQRFLEEAAR